MAGLVERLHTGAAAGSDAQKITKFAFESLLFSVPEVELRFGVAWSGLPSRRCMVEVASLLAYI